METIGFVFKSGRRLRKERVGRRRERGLGEMETIGFVCSNSEKAGEGCGDAVAESIAVLIKSFEKRHNS